MFNPSKLLIVSLLIFIIGLQGLSSVGAQSPTTFYLATSNSQTQNSSIWRILPQSNTSQLVFSISNIGDIPLIQALPASELNLLQQLRNNGFVLPILDSYRLGQTIEGIWALNTNQLLVLLDNRFCITIAERFCFGYFSYILLDVNAPTSQREIWRLSYHDVYSQVWEGCITSLDLDIADTHINPLQQMFAVVIRLPPGCLSTLKPVATLIIDYNSSPSQANPIASANYPAWSPDGEQLAYSIVSSNCSSVGCSGSIYIFNWVTGSSRVIASSPYFTNLPALVVWQNNQTVTYQFAPPFPLSESADNAADLLTVDVISGQQINDVPLETAATGLYVLQGQTGMGLLTTNTEGEQQAVGQENVVQLTTSASTVFFNERFPSYAFLGTPNSNAESLMVVDANLQMRSLSLTAYIPQGETLIDVSPAN